MVRTVLLAVALLAAVAVPAHAGGRGGFHDGRGFHGHHDGLRRHGRHVFFGSAFFIDPFPYYPYAYYPYPYDYPYWYPSPLVVEPPPIAAQEPIQREVIYPHGKYVLYGDGVTTPWQWVWIPAAPPPPPPSTPQP